MNSLRQFHTASRILSQVQLLDDFPRQHIPDFPLAELSSLDVSSNELTSVDFLKSLPSLTELRLSPGNPDLGEQSLFLSVFYCKKLTRINGEATDKYKASLKTLRKSLLQIVTEVWI